MQMRSHMWMTLRTKVFVLGALWFMVSYLCLLFCPGLGSCRLVWGNFIITGDSSSDLCRESGIFWVSDSTFGCWGEVHQLVLFRWFLLFCRGVWHLVCPLVIPPWGCGENQPQLQQLVILPPGSQSQSQMVTPHHCLGEGDGHIVECLRLGPSMGMSQGCLVVDDWQPWP